MGVDACALDLAARVGVPAHVTVTYPFRPVAALAEADHGRLERLFARVPSFTLTGERTAWFGDEVLYVEVNEARAVAALIAAVAAEFPEHPPYGGVFEEVVPHLTVGHDHDHETLRAAERGRPRPAAVHPARQPGRAVGRPVAGIGRQHLEARAGLSPRVNRGVDKHPRGLRGARRGLRVGVERATGQATVEQEGERTGQPARVGRTGIRRQAGDPVEYRGLVRDRAVVDRTVPERPRPPR